MTDEVEVEIPGEWRVRLSPEQGIEMRRDAARRAREEFSALLERHGVGSVAGARAVWRLASAITTAGERTQVIVLASDPERFANLQQAHRIEI